MIPVSCKEYIEYKENDGIIWKFVPKYGMLEREFVEMTTSISGMELIQQLDASDAFIDKILVGWTDEQKRMKPFPDNKKPSTLLSQNEKTQVLRYWMDASNLTPEEKKS